MRRWAPAVVAFFAAAVFLTAVTGCSGLWARLRPQPPPEPAVAAPEPAPLPPPPLTPARDMFPAQNWQITYNFDDGSRSEELLIPDGERLVQTYNGSPYITWFFASGAVLRADPKYREQVVLLRYLPEKLAHGTVWRQPSGAEMIWFQLERLPGCTVPGASPAECWQVQMINRREHITFTFATGLGPVAAVAENFAMPAESFRKKPAAQAQAQVPDPLRRTLLSRGLTAQAAQVAPLETAEQPDFAAAVAKARGGSGAGQR